MGYADILEKLKEIESILYSCQELRAVEAWCKTREIIDEITKELNDE